MDARFVQIGRYCRGLGIVTLAVFATIAVMYVSMVPVLRVPEGTIAVSKQGYLWGGIPIHSVHGAGEVTTDRERNLIVLSTTEPYFLHFTYSGEVPRTVSGSLSGQERLSVEFGGTVILQPELKNAEWLGRVDTELLFRVAIRMACERASAHSIDRAKRTVDKARLEQELSDRLTEKLRTEVKVVVGVNAEEMPKVSGGSRVPAIVVKRPEHREMEHVLFGFLMPWHHLSGIAWSTLFVVVIVLLLSNAEWMFELLVWLGTKKPHPAKAPKPAPPVVEQEPDAFGIPEEHASR